MTYQADRSEITAIRLSRGACFGTCPIYEVTLAADGTANWNGERFVERVGRYRGEADLNEVARLFAFVQRVDFFSWDDRYVSGVTDTPDYILTVESDRGSKSVLQNASEEPPDFWVIAALVDGLAETINWQQAEIPAAVAEVASQHLDEFRRRPAPASCRLLDFESAVVVTLESFPPQYIVTVTGTKPYMNMQVDLIPLQYIRQPEYWGIEAVGCLNGVGLPVMTPFTISLRLGGIVGTQGIEVIGASTSERLEVPPREPQGSPCFNWSAFHGSRPPTARALLVTGTCRFPTGGYVVKLVRHEPQGINPKDLLLDLIVQEPNGAVPDVITDVEARYEEMTEFEYETVTILPDGPTIPVEPLG